MGPEFMARANTRPKSLPPPGPGYLYVRPWQLSTPCHYLRVFKGCRGARVHLRVSLRSFLFFFLFNLSENRNESNERESNRSINFTVLQRLSIYVRYISIMKLK